MIRSVNADSGSHGPSINWLPMKTVKQRLDSLLEARFDLQIYAKCGALVIRNALITALQLHSTAKSFTAGRGRFVSWSSHAK